MTEQKPKNKFNNYVKYSNLAFQMMIIIVAGTFGGFKLDAYLNWDFPVFTLILSLGSVVVAIYLAVKDLIK
jgi:hypothetical protein